MAYKMQIRQTEYNEKKTPHFFNKRSPESNSKRQSEKWMEIIKIPNSIENWMGITKINVIWDIISTNKDKPRQHTHFMAAKGTKKQENNTSLLAIGAENEKEAKRINQ